MLFSIIIINYNSAFELKRCLESIAKFAGDLEHEIIVVDNCSSERDVESLPQMFPHVKFLFSDFNRGFGSGCNFGAAQSHGKFLGFVNPDVIFVSDILTQIIQEMGKDPMSGACGPMLIYENGGYQASAGFKMGICFELLESFGLMGIYRNIKSLEYRRMKVTRPVETGWVSGACMIVRRDVFERVNGYDERFFLNYEDIDLCRRIEEAGFVNYFFPYLNCIHVSLASQAGNFEKLVSNRYASRLVYSKKHYHPITGFVVRLLHLAGLLLRIMIMYLSRRNEENEGRLNGYKKSFTLYLKKGP